MKPFWKMKPEEFEPINDGSCKGDLQECVDTYLYKHKATGRKFCALEADFERMRGELKECKRMECPIEAYVVIGHSKLTDHFDFGLEEE